MPSSDSHCTTIQPSWSLATTATARHLQCFLATTSCSRNWFNLLFSHAIFILASNFPNLFVLFVSGGCCLRLSRAEVGPEWIGGYYAGHCVCNKPGQLWNCLFLPVTQCTRHFQWDELNSRRCESLLRPVRNVGNYFKWILWDLWGNSLSQRMPRAFIYGVLL